ncbi:hypothetical protein MA16_Dca019174 [Dendrobium catenatum]|uniref:Uncharacterized protein n=1 Tax=Dendrobium catenatum TaxID=906689 RepID=A0A2I0VYF1_9ASPA|nr:hypothetical protein MA16_Dca019174 [Dendrobium catenatum]
MRSTPQRATRTQEKPKRANPKGSRRRSASKTGRTGREKGGNGGTLNRPSLTEFEDRFLVGLLVFVSLLGFVCMADVSLANPWGKASDPLVAKIKVEPPSASQIAHVGIENDIVEIVEEVGHDLDGDQDTSVFYLNSKKDVLLDVNNAKITADPKIFILIDDMLNDIPIISNFVSIENALISRQENNEVVGNGADASNDSYEEGEFIPPSNLDATSLIKQGTSYSSLIKNVKDGQNISEEDVVTKGAEVYGFTLYCLVAVILLLFVAAGVYGFILYCLVAVILLLLSFCCYLIPMLKSYRISLCGFLVDCSSEQLYSFPWMLNLDFSGNVLGHARYLNKYRYLSFNDRKVVEIENIAIGDCVYEQEFEGAVESNTSASCSSPRRAPVTIRVNRRRIR